MSVVLNLIVDMIYIILIYKKLKKNFLNLKLNIKKISINNLKFPEKRPKNLSLKSNKLEKLINFKIII